MAADTERKVWNFLKQNGMTDAGAAGCMGNFYAESAITFEAVEKAKLKKLGMTAAQYVQAVDSGAYSRDTFIHDGVGVSLYQATYWTLKADLYDLAKSRGVSVVDPDMVLDSFIAALKKYAPAVLKTLQSTSSVQEASSTVMLKFERPADQSAANQAKRAGYCRTYYDRYGGGGAAAGNGGGDMSISPLATYVNTNHSNQTKPRRGKIQYIIPHCYVGQVTAKRGVDGFLPNGRGASAHYVVGKDGDIGCNVDEKNRAWTTGGDKTCMGWTGGNIDHYGVTIEVACDTVHPYWITDAAYNALVRLMADIAKRNGLGKLTWQANPNLVGHPEQQNVIVHRWFASKACPGDYIFTHLGDICARANAINYPAAAPAPQEEEEMDQNKFNQMLANALPQTKFNDMFAVAMANYRHTLQDNDSSAWSQEARDWAVSKGIFQGSTENLGTGEPNYMWEDLLTREQAAALIYRFAQDNGLA